MKGDLDEFRGVWTLGEQRGGEVNPVSLELLAWGRELADNLGVDLASVVIGSGLVGKVDRLFHYGADRVYVVDDPALEHFQPDAYLKVLVNLVEEFKPEIFVASATTYGRTIMPLLAATVETGLTADCTGLEIESGTRLLLQTRPAIGGNVMATIKTPIHRPQMATVRPKAKRPMAPDVTRKGETIARRYPAQVYESRVRFIEFRKDDTVETPIQEADVVVAGGKGLKDAKNANLLYELAELLGGAVGASRSVVDMGWVSYSHQVGLSGKTVCPRLYIALGISGAVQHLAGMSSAENVIAVNIDPEAGIFQVSDLGVVSDLLDVIPEVAKTLKARQGRAKSRGG